MLTKPAFGQRCNQCGFCCIAEPCKLANEYLLCHQGPCKALEIEGGKHYCGLVRRPVFYLFGQDVPAGETDSLSCLFARALGLGVGCDADDPPANLGASLVCPECGNVLIDPKYRDPDHHCPACGSTAVRKPASEAR